jgi:hypothetical protein
MARRRVILARLLQWRFQSLVMPAVLRSADAKGFFPAKSFLRQGKDHLTI